MSRLERIIASGNRPPLRVPYGAGWTEEGWTEEQRENWIVCADGFKVSVVAGDGTYCYPRPSEYANLGDVSQDYSGPYSAVEVGFPSERPEPWECPHPHAEYGDYCGASPEQSREAWACYAETRSDPTETVYGRVPVGMVRALVALHGGEAS